MGGVIQDGLGEDREPQVQWDVEFGKGIGGERLSDEVQRTR